MLLLKRDESLEVTSRLEKQVRECLLEMVPSSTDDENDEKYGQDLVDTDRSIQKLAQ